MYTSRRRGKIIDEYKYTNFRLLGKGNLILKWIGRWLRSLSDFITIPISAWVCQWFGGTVVLRWVNKIQLWSGRDFYRKQEDHVVNWGSECFDSGYCRQFLLIYESLHDQSSLSGYIITAHRIFNGLSLLKSEMRRVKCVHNNQLILNLQHPHHYHTPEWAIKSNGPFGMLTIDRRFLDFSRWASNGVR